MKRFCIVAAAVLALVVGYVLQDVLSVTGEKPLAYNDRGCELLGAQTLRGGEDVAFWRNGIVVVAAGDLETTFSKGPEAAQLTGVFALSLRAAAAGRPTAAGAGLTRLELLGFPEGPPLVGHGLYISNRTERLYVINHGDSISRVEIFELEGEGVESLRVHHVDRIESSLFPYHSINDVVEGRNPNEVFVSVWRNLEGPKGYEWQSTDEAKNFLLYRYISKRLGKLGVLRCAKKQGSWSCERSAAWGMPTANGLTISPDRTTLLVSCPLCLEVWQFRVGADGSLEESGPRLPLPYPADNLEWDEATGRVFMGMIPVGSRRYPAQAPMELMALPVSELAQKPPPKPSSLLLHDGSKLSQCSAGLQYGQVVLLGSPYHPGLLLCSRAQRAVIS